MKYLQISVIAAIALTSGVSMASESLANQKACLACHAAKEKKIGPSFASIAEKYAKDKAAEEKVAVSIQKGGSGKWGAIPMPAQPGVSEAEAKTLAKWILAAKK
jgi:cytochrome c